MRLSPALALAGALPLLAACGVDDGDAVCTEIGCTDSIAVEYSRELAAPYSLVVEVGGVFFEAACPTTLRHPDGVELTCTATGFTLGKAPGTPWGRIPGDAEIVEVEVELDPLTGTPEAQAELLVPTERFQPNGPDCPPVCHQGETTLAIP